jgi:hypothetical protein
VGACLQDGGYNSARSPCTCVTHSSTDTATMYVNGGVAGGNVQTVEKIAGGVCCVHGASRRDLLLCMLHCKAMRLDKRGCGKCHFAPRACFFSVL